MSASPTSPTSVQTRLRLGTGFSELERVDIVGRLSSLDARLATFPAEGTELELSVKDRERSGQRVTLECWIPRRGHFVATSADRDLWKAITEVRQDLRRQLNDAKTRTEPRNRSLVLSQRSTVASLTAAATASR